MSTKNHSNDIYLTRLYDAPLQAVWNAWTDPKQTAEWWGPRGFTITTLRKDVRTGGMWDYTMHGPDGVDYPNVTNYLEVQPLSRLVYDHGGTATQPPMFRVTVDFKETSGKTNMDMTMTLPTAEAATQTKKFIRQAGGDATWDRLAEFLEKEISGKEKFFINRSFAAPIERLYQMWTDPNHFSKWLPPTGFDMTFVSCNLVAGGKSFYFMSSAEGAKMYGRANYLELHRPDRVVYTQQFCDENENVVRHPLVPTWPETMLTTVALNSEGPTQTRITITWETVANASKEELETFIEMRGGMTQGWTGSFDKLETYLKQDSL
jgi:uncharacterized protein YndB with AHSA1/START domain